MTDFSQKSNKMTYFSLKVLKNKYKYKKVLEIYVILFTFLGILVKIA